MDEIGCELEQPFGVDPNDIKLIEMGDELAKDLDALLRTANKQRVNARHDPVATRRSFDDGGPQRVDLRGALGAAAQSPPQAEVPVVVLSDSI